MTPLLLNPGRAAAYTLVLLATGFVWGALASRIEALRNARPIPNFANNRAVAVPILVTWSLLAWVFGRTYLLDTGGGAAQGLRLGMLFAFAAIAFDLTVVAGIVGQGLRHLRQPALWLAYGLLVAVPWIVGVVLESRPPPGTQAQLGPVAMYFQTRDGFVRKFGDATGLDEDRSALSELEGLLQSIIGPANAEGFPRYGKINLQTLVKELGYGQVDGLAFGSGRERLFITTQEVLQGYLAEWPDLPGGLTELSGTGEFYRRVFIPDAAVTLYAELPVNSTGDGYHARAFLALIAQDIGPFVPEDVFVSVATGDRIFVVHAPVTTEIAEIPHCRNEWQTFAVDSAEAYEAYRASELVDRPAFERYIKLQSSGFEAYHRCYAREAGNQEFFVPLRDQAQAIADRLQRSR